MKEIIIGGKTVLVTDIQYKEYRKHKNRERYIFGRQEWNAKVCQLEHLPFQVPSKIDVEEEFEKSEDTRKLWAALEKLNEISPKSFEIINLYFFENYKPKELMKHFGIARSTVDLRLEKALNLLRNLMRNELEK